jgi:hypothetical protein
MGMIEKYTETRVDYNKFKSIFSFLDKRSVNLPNQVSILDRLKMMVGGTFYQADFIIGYSFNNRLNFEIWSVTEPNPEYTPTSLTSPKIINSFYLYDVTSAILIRKYIPYRRNAEQLLIQKIGTLSKSNTVKKPQPMHMGGFNMNREPVFGNMY